MARYYSLRGHLECDETQVPAIRERVRAVAEASVGPTLTHEVKELYLGGWRFPTTTINWLSFIFYGAVVQYSGRDLLWRQLAEIGKLSEVSGAFLVDDDEGEERCLWIVEHGAVSERGRDWA